MKIPSLLAVHFTWLGAKVSFLLSIPFLLGLVSLPTRSPADAPFTFHNTGSLNTARRFHTTTLLSNGKVLAAGGSSSSGAIEAAP